MSAGILSSTDFPNSAARMLSIGNHSVCLHSTVREYAVLLCYTTNGLLTIHLDLYNHKKVVLSIIIDTRRAHNDVIIVRQQQRPAQKCSLKLVCTRKGDTNSYRLFVFRTNLPSRA